jgi:hypothetical protein
VSTKDNGFRARMSIDDEYMSRASVKSECQERAMRAINSGDGLYKASTKGGNTIVIDSYRRYRFYTKSGG